MKPSSYILFARKIRGKHWTKRMIRRKFELQVDPTDYERKERQQILDYLFALSAKS